ncbi:hypothetical protein QQ008_10835 [Fulvivirgaceae bacterium BMA10]|uniref:Uncharacterized protein n=1 Tax=Splendidivirga corallicola TaxID=3051826 RepID=A0ABT8KMB6_9BACT|nr:hypothetical protein [Fulvivirgaceae bacterium BMA10]
MAVRLLLETWKVVQKKIKGRHKSSHVAVVYLGSQKIKINQTFGFNA